MMMCRFSAGLFVIVSTCKCEYVVLRVLQPAVALKDLLYHHDFALTRVLRGVATACRTLPTRESPWAVAQLSCFLAAGSDQQRSLRHHACRSQTDWQWGGGTCIHSLHTPQPLDQTHRAVLVRAHNSIIQRLCSVYATHKWHRLYAYPNLISAIASNVICRTLQYQLQTRATLSLSEYALAGCNTTTVPSADGDVIAVLREGSIWWPTNTEP